LASKSFIMYSIVIALLVFCASLPAENNTLKKWGSNCWETDFYTKNKNRIFPFAEKYKKFLSTAKTEREVIIYIEKILKKNGFKSLQSFSKSKGSALTPGDKIYATNRGKALTAVIIGKKPLSQGFRLIETHGDATHIDLKQNPLYTSEEFALFQTHYYGGIKKYLYLNVPLALHGIIVKKNGEKINVVVGENEDEPVFAIPDLLIHLSYLADDDGALITGEKLDPLVGSISYEGKEKTNQKIKKNIMQILEKKYGMVEQDFISAELQLVPAGKARDVGLDQGMIGGFGQDDRICTFIAYQALVDLKVPQYTSIIYVNDKEEVGYAGNTGQKSPFLESTIARIIELTTGQNKEQLLRQTFFNSRHYYCDATSGVNPLFPEVHELSNAPRLSYGLCINARADDASDVAYIRNVLDQHNIPWQTGSFGRSPGAFAPGISPSDLGLNIIFLGIPVLSIHSPFSISSKIDLYANFVAYKILLAE